MSDRLYVKIACTALLAVAFPLALIGANAQLFQAQAQAQAPAPKAPTRPAAPTVAPVPRPAPAAGNEAKPGPSQSSGQTPSQSQPANPAQGSGPQNPTGSWIARCVSESRQSPVECSMEETVTLTSTGQLLASMLVRVPADTRSPVVVVQVPSGLFLPAGLNLQVDEGKPQPLPLQTCDQKGCYALMPMTADLLASLKSGKRLTITYQNMAKSNVTVPLALDNFAEAYQKIQ
jgi:invasion protein IalB